MSSAASASRRRHPGSLGKGKHGERQMDAKAVGILLIIGAVILFFTSIREQRQGRAGFFAGFFLGGVSVVLLVVGFMLLSR